MTSTKKSTNIKTSKGLQQSLGNNLHSQAGNYRPRGTCLLDLVAFSQHRGNRPRIHLLPPALFLQSLAGGARVRHISLPFLHLPWCVCLLHPQGKSSVNRKSQLPGQAAVRISPLLSEMLTVPASSLLCTCQNWLVLISPCTDSLLSDSVTDPRSPWNQAVSFQANIVMAGWFSSLSCQSGLQYEELFLHQLGPCADYRERCAVERASQANDAGVTHDALLLSMFLLPRL